MRRFDVIRRLAAVACAACMFLTGTSVMAGTDIEMSDIAVTIEERDGRGTNCVAGKGNAIWFVDRNGERVLSGGTLLPCVSYGLDLSVKNSGGEWSCSSYDRMSIRKYWMDMNNKKFAELSPGLIGTSLEMAGWIDDGAAKTPERTVLYHDDMIAPGDAVRFMSTFRVDPAVLRWGLVEKSSVSGPSGVTSVVFENTAPDKLLAHVECHADAVQDHNAKDAIWSAWGRRVEISPDGKLSLS